MFIIVGNVNAAVLRYQNASIPLSVTKTTYPSLVVLINGTKYYAPMTSANLPSPVVKINYGGTVYSVGNPPECVYTLVGADPDSYTYSRTNGLWSATWQISGCVLTPITVTLNGTAACISGNNGCVCTINGVSDSRFNAIIGTVTNYAHPGPGSYYNCRGACAWTCSTLNGSVAEGPENPADLWMVDAYFSNWTP